MCRVKFFPEKIKKLFPEIIFLENPKFFIEIEFYFQNFEIKFKYYKKSGFQYCSSLESYKNFFKK